MSMRPYDHIDNADAFSILNAGASDLENIQAELYGIRHALVAIAKLLEDR